MEPKIIFLDIDGTLTEPGSNEPPKSALLAIEEARRRGHYVFLCSGRNYDMLSPLLKYDFDGVSASSGGYIEYRGETIYDCPMTQQQRERIMELLQECGVYRTVECMDGAYTDDGFKQFLKEHAAEGSNSELLRWREQIEKSLHIRSMAEYRGQPAYKVAFMAQTIEQVAGAQKLLEDEFAFCILNDNEHGFVNGEIISRRFDKGTAVERVCTHLGLPVRDSIAFGDSMNDKEMLEAAGLGICMGNGSSRLKELADDICPPVLEDGLQCAFQKYGLIHT